MSDYGLPLDGVRVIDITHYLAGPYCGTVLADLGADVVKIEPPGTGERSRNIGTVFAGGESALFMGLNRNKRSLAVDLNKPEGRRLVTRLAEAADVIIENYRPGTLKRFDLDYVSLSARNPKIVYASISGYGPGGPRGDSGGFNLVLQAETGLLAITGEEGGRPAAIPLDLLDTGTGMYAAIGILAALNERHSTGRGRHVELSLLDTAIGWTIGHMTVFHLSGQVPERLGTADKNTVPSQAFKTKTGYVVISTGASDTLWARLCSLLDTPELAHDERFADNVARVKNRHDLVIEVEAALAARSSDDWVELFRAQQIPSAPVNSIALAFSHPQVLYNGDVLTDLHPTAGELKMPALPVRFDNTPRTVRRSAPLLSQGGADACAEWIGMGEAEIENLVKSGAVSPDPMPSATRVAP